MLAIDHMGCARVENLPPGTIAWLSDIPTPVLVLLAPGKTDEGEDLVLLMDLGGDQPFDIWTADQVEGRTALFLADIRLEVDHQAHAPLLSATQRIGHAFVSPDGRGIIGGGPRRSGFPKPAGPFTIGGQHVKLTADSKAFSFSKWRIVHGTGDDAITIFEHDAATV
jgi:hypothetical protein